MSFPKKGKFFPKRSGGNGSEGSGEPPDRAHFATEIAGALRRALGSTHAAVKTAADWTGANERTAKNWFSGRYGPCGKHLVSLAYHSDEVLNTFLGMAGRCDLIAAAKIIGAEKALVSALEAVRNLNDGSDVGNGPDRN